MEAGPEATRSTTALAKTQNARLPPQILAISACQKLPSKNPLPRGGEIPYRKDLSFRFGSGAVTPDQESSDEWRRL